jgi:hypothetical protein
MEFMGRKFKKPNKTQKNPPGWFFFKPGFLPTLFFIPIFM